MNLENKNVLIVGYGESGKSAYQFLKNKKCNCYIYDEKIKKHSKLQDIAFSLAVVSPGIQNDSDIIKSLLKRGVPTITEVELGLLFCNTKKIIALTGTNGKTTTVSLIGHILTVAGKTAYVCGNNGVPVTSLCEKVLAKDYIVLELSSFMLEKIKNAGFKVACILNLEPDHLNYHKNAENYYKCKKRIFNFININDFAVVNADDKNLRGEKFPSKVFYFSTKNKVNGVYLKNGKIYFNSGEVEIELFDKSYISLLGEFNLSNCLCAILVCLLLKVGVKKIKEGVNNFRPVKHRLNLIYSDKFKVYNDSKATNVASLKASLSCFGENVILVMGGSDKGERFDEIFEAMKLNVKLAIFTGAVAKKLKYHAISKDFEKYVMQKNFKRAVKHAIDIAKNNDIVLFSPACASFDHFKNFEQRGEVFEKLARKYIEKRENKT